MLLNKYKICKEYGQMTDSCQPSHKIIRPSLLTWGLVNKTKIEKISLKHGSLISSPYWTQLFCLFHAADSFHVRSGGHRTHQIASCILFSLPPKLNTCQWQKDGLTPYVAQTFDQTRKWTKRTNIQCTKTSDSIAESMQTTWIWIFNDIDLKFERPIFMLHLQ